MSVTRFLSVYAVTLPVFFAIDLVWLGVVAKTFYRQHLGHLLAADIAGRVARVLNGLRPTWMLRNCRPSPETISRISDWGDAPRVHRRRP